MVCLFKKTADVSVEMTEVIARTPPPAFLFPDQRFQRPRPELLRPHRLAPVVGGGGDLVASVFRVKRLIRRRTSFLRPLRRTSGAAGAASLERANPGVNRTFRSFSACRSRGNFRPQKVRSGEVFLPRCKPAIQSKARNLTEDV